MIYSNIRYYIFAILLYSASGLLVACSEEGKQQEAQSEQREQSADLQVDHDGAVEHAENMLVEEKPADKQNEVNLSAVDGLIAELQTENDIQALQTLAEKSTEYEEDRVSAKVISELFAKRFNEGLENNLKPEKRKCFGKLHYGFAITDMDKVLRRQLSAHEYNTLNAFNRSALGHKVAKYTDYFFSSSSRMLSSEERRSLSDFSSTREGHYMKSLRKNPELLAVLEQKTKQKLAGCGVVGYQQERLYRLR